MSEKIQKLKDLLKILDDGVTKPEFLKSFKSVLAQIAKLEQNLIAKIDYKTSSEKEALDELKKEFNQIIEEAKKESDSTLGGFKRRTMEAINSLFTSNRVNQKLNEKINEVDRRLSMIRDGIDGQDGRDGQDGLDGINGKDGSSDTAETIADKLETLEEDDKLGIEAIKGLKDRIMKLETMPTGRIGGARKTVYIKRENLTSQCDGSTKTFTLPKDTIDVLAVFGTQFPVNFNPGTDWTFEGRTLTLTDEVSAPESGQTLYALIQCQFYG